MDWDVFERAVDEDWIDDVVRMVKSGKEATVYLYRGDVRAQAELVAAKVYRERQQRSFKNDAVYWEGGTRAWRRRERLAAQKHTSFGQEARFGGWVGREYESLKAAYAAGVSVPRPIGRVDNLLVLDWIGDEDGAAPQLRHACPHGAGAAALFDQVLAQVELLLAANLIHADLSEYNVLLDEDRVVLTDFPQAVDPRFNNAARALLERDLANLARFFATRGAERDIDALAADLWNRWLASELVT